MSETLKPASLSLACAFRIEGLGLLLLCGVWCGASGKVESQKHYRILIQGWRMNERERVQLRNLAQERFRRTQIHIRITNGHAQWRGGGLGARSGWEEGVRERWGTSEILSKIK